MPSSWAELGIAALLTVRSKVHTGRIDSNRRKAAFADYADYADYAKYLIMERCPAKGVEKVAGMRRERIPLTIHATSPSSVTFGAKSRSRFRETAVTLWRNQRSRWREIRTEWSPCLRSDRIPCAASARLKTLCTM